MPKERAIPNGPKLRGRLRRKEPDATWTPTSVDKQGAGSAPGDWCDCPDGGLTHGSEDANVRGSWKGEGNALCIPVTVPKTEISSK